MNEATGVIDFLNIHDYVSDYDGTRWDGCLSSLKTDDGETILLYTASHRLQAALVVAFHTKTRVTVSFGNSASFLNAKGDREAEKLLSSLTSSGGGPLFVKAVWTRK